jgi:hypothetical protein
VGKADADQAGRRPQGNTNRRSKNVRFFKPQSSRVTSPSTVFSPSDSEEKTDPYLDGLPCARLFSASLYGGSLQGLYG